MECIGRAAPVDRDVDLPVRSRPSPGRLSEYLGHSDPAFTLRVYAQMQTTSYEHARQAIDKHMMRLRAIAGDG